MILTDFASCLSFFVIFATRSFPTSDFNFHRVSFPFAGNVSKKWPLINAQVTNDALILTRFSRKLPLHLRTVIWKLFAGFEISNRW